MGGGPKTGGNNGGIAGRAQLGAMPLAWVKNVAPGVRIAGWWLAEPEAALAAPLRLDDQERQTLAAITHPRKRLEFLGQRRALYDGLGVPTTYRLRKTEVGRPYLEQHGLPSFQGVACSHAGPLVVVLWAPALPVGLDIDALTRTRPLPTAPLFMNAAELATFRAHPTAEAFYAVWSAKEALFKAFNRPEELLAFRPDMQVDLPPGGRWPLQPFQARVRGHLPNHEGWLSVRLRPFRHRWLAGVWCGPGDVVPIGTPPGAPWA